MNDRCERIRERIEDSVGRAPGAEEQAALDVHCAGCESCREYRKRLIADHSRLDAFAALHSTSEQRFEERVIEMLPAETPVRALRPGFRATFARVPRAVCIAGAVAAAIAVVAGIDFLRGAHNGAVPAFASVVEKMEQAENVVYRDREWYFGKWQTIERGSNQSGLSRATYEDSALVFYHGGEGGELRIYPAKKRAVVIKRTYFADQMSEYSDLAERDPAMKRILQRQIETQKDPMGWVVRLYKKKGHTFVRRERRDGKNLAVYEYRKGKNYTWTTWVDVETELPFRVEIVSARGEKSTSLGLDVTDFLPPGSPRASAAGWTEMEPGEPKSIYDNFRWNAPVDTSYFSLTPPSGYAVTTIDQNSDPDSLEQLRKEFFEQFRKEAPFTSHEFARALSLWVSLSGGAFPDDVHDMVDSSKAKPLLVTKHNKNGIPGDEFRAAMHDVRTLESGFGSISRYVKEGTFHYFGTGLVFGDSTRVVCWGEESGENREFFDNPFWIIYADLHCVPSMRPPKIPER